MLDLGLNTRIFQRKSNSPIIAAVYVNPNASAGTANDSFSRIVKIGSFKSQDNVYGYEEAEFKNFDKSKIVSLNSESVVDKIIGKSDKSIIYNSYEDPLAHTEIYKGFVPTVKTNKGVIPVKGTEKVNYAILTRELEDGDIVKLTMKQGKNGKYETIAMKSLDGKTLAELPQVKEMLLRLDNLVKRFIKAVK